MIKSEPLDSGELANTSLLKDVELGSVLGLLEDCPVKKLKAGEILMYAEKQNESVYLVLSGRLRVHLKLNLDPIAILEPGEVVGEISMIDGRPTTASVMADEDCRLLVLDKYTFWSLAEASSGVARNLLHILASRLRQGDSLISTGQEFQREYARYAVLDAVTGLYNRRWFDAILVQQMKRCNKDSLNLALLLVGIDRFKEYTQAHGHVSRESALHSITWSLRANTRPGELSARYGEEELVVLLPNTEAPAARKFGERICRAIAKADVQSIDRRSLPSVSVSVGVALMTGEDTPISFITAATKALHDAQQRGGNRVSYLQD